jgi:hypothetical protein
MSPFHLNAIMVATFAANVNIGLPAIDLGTSLVRVIALIPLVGGFLLAREGRGNLLWEIFAVLLLVLATVVPITGVTLEGLPDIFASLINRLPVALLLLGLAFVRDGGLKMIVGLVLIVVSGFILLPIRA